MFGGANYRREISVSKSAKKMSVFVLGALSAGRLYTEETVFVHGGVYFRDFTLLIKAIVVDDFEIAPCGQKSIHPTELA